ncbi:MAG: hypothetical protein LAT76_03710, partial [Schleiferiaceae bacterium]|nr:hypothetical protein [Schleiferiaceae bacterium]
VLLSLPWQLRNIHIGGSKYVNQLVMKNPYRPEEGTLAIGDWFERIFNNIYRYAASEIPSTFYPVLQIEYYEDPEPVHLLLGIPIILLCLIGLRAQKKFQQLLVSYLIASFGILWLWPDIWFGPRFMLPLYPILLFLALNGIKQIITTYTPLKNFSPYWFLLLILFIIPPVKGLNQFAKNSYLPEYERYFEAAKWVKKNTPKTAIVTTRKPDLFFLFAERPCINYPYDTNYTSFLDTLSARGVTHIVMEQLGYSSGIRYLYPAIVANQEKIRTVYQTPEPEAYVFAFDNTYGYRGEWRIDGDVNTSQKPVIGVKEGEGTYIFTDGSRYEGSWRSDARNGFGVMYYPDGSRFEGQWKNNRMEGPGKLFDSSGNLVKEGIWSDDELLP